MNKLKPLKENEPIPKSNWIPRIHYDCVVKQELTAFGLEQVFGIVDEFNNGYLHLDCGAIEEVIYNLENRDLHIRQELLLCLQEQGFVD